MQCILEYLNVVDTPFIKRIAGKAARIFPVSPALQAQIFYLARESWGVRG